MRLLRLAALLSFGLVFGLLSAVAADPGPLGRPAHPRIINGAPTAGFPSVGALLDGNDPATATAGCTGTMIGCETMLTAAHCVDPEDSYVVFLPHAGFFPVASMAINPDLSTFRGDLAVLKLGGPITGIRPSRLNTLGPVPDGTVGTIVGHGFNLTDGLGLQHVGKVTTSACPPPPPPPYASPQGSICWFIEEPYGPLGLNSTLCNGDSGGPLFVDLGGGPMVAGAASGILALDRITGRCIPPQYGVEAPVDAFLPWIEAEGGADLANTTCGDVLQSGDPGSSSAFFTGSLDAAVPDAHHSIVVPAGTAELRVALAGGARDFDLGPDDLDLYVRAGSPPSTSDFDCAGAGLGQFAACTFAAPAPGAWHVLVRRKSGAASYQVTVTLLGRDCAAPGTDGLACDDLNPCSTGDVCASGVCGGTSLPDATACNDGDQCTGPDACTAGTCAGPTVADGTPCDDGDRCSLPDTCVAGACTGTSPATGCTLATAPAAGTLQVIDLAKDRGDTFAWTWSKGGATTIADFGDPTTVTDYAVCAYDRATGVPERVLAARVPAGTGWKSTTKGFQFKNDRDLSRGGITGLQLRAGPAGKASIKMKGKSRVVGVPDLPLAKDPTVTVQLVSPDACWQSDFSTASKNDDRQFKARAD